MVRLAGDGGKLIQSSRAGQFLMSSNLILIVEDQPSLLHSLSRGMVAEGYDIRAATTLREAKRFQRTNRIAAILLDVMLPDGSGLDWLKELRSQKFADPVLIITARDAVDDRIQGLDLGADDYLVKPFNLDELLARLRAVLRRSTNRLDSVLKVDDLECYLVDRVVRRAGKEILLTQRQFELLAYLMQSAGDTIGREQIARDVWKEPTATWTNVIEVQITHLRRKIERPDLPALLHTIRGEGYVLGRRE